MKKLLLLIPIIFALTTLLFSDGYQIPKYDIFSLENTKNNVFRVQENFKDLYSKLNLMVKTYGNQTIDGEKTFTSSLVAQSSMTVYGSINTQGKHWELIWSTVTVTQVSTITITGLNGNADIMYKVDYDIGQSQSLTEAWIGIILNNDKTVNYGSSWSLPDVDGYQRSSIDVSKRLIYMGYVVLQANVGISGFFTLKARTGSSKYRKLQGISYYNDGTKSGAMPYTGYWSNTADNITRMDFVSDAAGNNTFCVGTEIYVWALR